MLASILINNYNYEKYLEASIKSALAQTYSSVEVVVVDDGSTDGSKQIIERFSDRVVSVLKSNGGQASAINAGFEACSGSYIFLLDADDCFSADKLTHTIQTLEAHPDASWCFHELEDVDSDGCPIPNIKRHQITAFESVNLRSVLTTGKNFRHWFPATSGLCFRRELLAQILPMPEVFQVSADAFIRLAAIYMSPGVLLPETLATHRRHGKNLYENRPDIHIEYSKVHIKAAYFLRCKFPETRPFTNREVIFNTGKMAEYALLKLMFSMPEYRRYIAETKDVAFFIFLTAYLVKGNLKRLLRSRY